MPGDPKECRVHARNCRTLALTARNAEAAENFLLLAETWDSLAGELESNHVFLATMNAIEPDQSETTKAA